MRAHTVSSPGPIEAALPGVIKFIEEVKGPPPVARESALWLFRDSSRLRLPGSAMILVTSGEANWGWGESIPLGMTLEVVMYDGFYIELTRTGMTCSWGREHSTRATHEALSLALDRRGGHWPEMLLWNQPIPAIIPMGLPVR